MGALFVALGLAAGTAGAVNKWIAVGDSIMVGSTWPALSGCSICPAVFDCSGGCNLTPSAARDQCGIVRRLDTFLGGTDYVKNLGVGGESTAGGLSRLQMTVLPGECPGSPGDCIAMILMHGTNDMLATISPETATANLQLMIAATRSNNIDTLLMTVIRKAYDEGNTKWLAYRNLIAALAASENVPLVDPYASLCPNTGCYDTNYWVANSCFSGNPGEYDIGHPDPDGYDVMGNLVTVAFPGAVPAAPTTSSPAGDICTQTPQFVWPEVASARWYALEVDATTTWWEAAVHCAGGTCTATPAGSLGAGAHAWRVRGRNLRGLGSFSATANFTVGPPPAPMPVAPTGAIFPSAPTYEWLEVPCATEYDYEVRDAMGNLEVQATNLLASTVCSAGRCTHQGATISDPDDYTLEVLARNALGGGPLSAPGAQFTILACGDPSAKELKDLEPSPVTVTKTVTWCGPVSAAKTVPYTIESAGDLTVHTGASFTAHDDFTVRGNLTVKSP